MAKPAIKIRPHQSADQSACDHCGGIQRTVWGYASRRGQAWAIYYARFTYGHPELGVQLLVSIGGWGAEEDESGRVALAALCLEETGRPNFTPTDAAAIDWSEQEFLGEKLTAEAFGSSELEDDALQLMRSIVFEDERVRLFVTRDGRDAREAKVWLERAHARLQMGDDAEAVACATLAIGHDPDVAEAYFVRGWARGREGDFAEALEDLDLFLERAPSSPKAKRAIKIRKVYQKKRDAAAGDRS